MPATSTLARLAQALSQLWRNILLGEQTNKKLLILMSNDSLQNHVLWDTEIPLTE